MGRATHSQESAAVQTPDSAAITTPVASAARAAARVATERLEGPVAWTRDAPADVLRGGVAEDVGSARRRSRRLMSSPMVAVRLARVAHWPPRVADRAVAAGGPPAPPPPPLPRK